MQRTAGMLVLASVLAAPSASQAAEQLNDIRLVTGAQVLLERTKRISDLFAWIGKAHFDEEDGNGGGGADLTMFAEEPAASGGGSAAWYALASGSYTHLDSDDPGAPFDGYIATASAGLDYQFTSNLIAGLLVQYDNTDLDTNISGLTGTSDSEGIGVGPYAFITLHDNIYLSLSYFYSWSDTDVADSLPSNGSYDSESWIASATLTGRWSFGATTILPSVGVSYSWAEDDAFTDSGGFMFPSLTTEIGTLNFGATVSRELARQNDWTFSGWLAANGVWEFDVQSNAPTTVSTSLNDEDVSASFSAGIDISNGAGVDLSLYGSYGSIGIDDYEDYSFGGSLGILF